MLNYKGRIADHIHALFLDMDKEEIVQLLEYPPSAEMGDLSLPCFRFSKVLKKSPQSIADELKSSLSDPVIERIESVSGYLNIFLDKSLFSREVIHTVLSEGERYGSQEIGQGKSVVIDYSSPNIAKPFHVAHLRSTVIGNALNHIYSFLGYKTIGINHLGDWGTQFGKLIVAYHAWGNKERIEAEGIDELLRLYVKFHDESEKEPALEDQARAWFLKLEQGDQEALELWQWFVDISLNEFRKIYKLLGVQFDYYTGESFYNDKMSLAVEQLREKELLVEDDGAYLVRLEEFEMAPALILKKDGSSLYHTRDITAALYRKEKYDFDKVIYITDYAQNLHFQQWFKVIELMGYEWAKDLIHVPFGRVSIEGKSLSTRKGNVVKLEELLQQAISKTRSIIEEKNPNLDNKDEVARQIGVGAIIFNDLSGNRIKDIDFSWGSALNFEGETGPYAQYTYARMSIVLRKSNETIEISDLLNVEHLQNIEIQRLLKQIYLFPEVVEQAMHKLEPSLITRYIIDLAQAFNRFYHACPILVEDSSVKWARLSLVKCVQHTLYNGLRLIGLHALERV